MRVSIEKFGIENNSNIFVVKIVKFIISNDLYYLNEFPKESQLSQLIYDLLGNSGLDPFDIEKYVYNNKTINQSLALEQSGITQNSEIKIYFKNNISFKSISITFSNVDVGKKIVKCVSEEKFSSLIRKFEEVSSNKDSYVRYIIGLNEIDNYDNLKWNALKDKTVQDLGLKDGSTIVYTYKYKKN